MKTGSMWKFNLSELIIVGLFFVGLLLGVTQDADQGGVPETSIVETLAEHTDEIERTN